MKRKQMAVAALLLTAGMSISAYAEEMTIGEQEIAVGETMTGEQEVSVGETTSGQVASADEMVTPEDIVTEDMVPISGSDLNDGIYDVEVLSSSSMFKVAACQLTVENGAMSADLTIASDSYLKLFLGTGAEAVGASEEECISFELDEAGNQVYTVPVEALDKGIDCAAWSRRREKWYDRILVFSASTLPQSAFKEGWILTAEDIGLEDGVYTVEVTLGGATGKTAVETPTEITVENGEVTATITFNSTNYDYVAIEGEKFELISEEGNSSFVIPVGGFDWNMPIKADSVALGKPRELDYTLYFDAETISEK